MAKRGMAMSATTKANIGAGRKAGLRLNSKGLGTSPFSQAKSAASKSVRKVNSEVKSKIAKAKKKGIAGKPKVNKENLDPTPSPDSFRISKAKAILENTMRAKTRLARRVTNYNNNDSLIEFAERDGEWRKNLSLSLKRYWARKRPGRIEGNIGELQQAKKRYDSGESPASILLDPNLSGKTKTEIVGKKVGELRGKFDVIVDHIKDRGKDFKRGFKGSRRDVMGRNIAEKYNLDVVVPAVGAVGLGVNTGLALRGRGFGKDLNKLAINTARGVKLSNRAKYQSTRDLVKSKQAARLSQESFDRSKKILSKLHSGKHFKPGTKLAALGALGLGAYSIATQVQRHRKPQTFKYRKDYSALEFARTKGARDKNPRKKRSRRIVEGSLAGAGIGAGTAVGSGALTGGVLVQNEFRNPSSKNSRMFKRELFRGILTDIVHNKYEKKFVKKMLLPGVAITGGILKGAKTLKNKKLMAASVLAGGLYGAYKGNKRFNKEGNK